MDNTERLFIALMPKAAIRQQLDTFVTTGLQATESLLGAQHVVRVESHNYHITLMFLSNVSKDLVPEIIANLRHIHVEPFNLLVNTTGYFKKRKIFWLGVRKIPYELEYLRDALNMNLQRVHSLDITNTNKDFVPHITILKKVDDPQIYKQLQKDYLKIPWSVASFFLVKSIHEQDRIKYEVLAEFSMP